MIVAAAIRRGLVWALPAPARPHDVIRLMIERGIPASGPYDYGFIDSNEGFVLSERARALLQGQVNSTSHGTKLFTEDLW